MNSELQSTLNLPSDPAVASSVLLSRVLDRIQDAAKEADEKAEESCKKSKYSIQDYWMCMEFWAQRLHDDLAREHGLERRCPHYPFRVKLAAFKRDVATRDNAEVSHAADSTKPKS